MKVYVTFDPINEEVVCVHKKRGETCDMCFDPNDKDKKWKRYHETEHEVVDE